jgi:TPR repeat protein
MSVFLQSLGAPRAEIDQRSRAPRVLPPQFRVQDGPRGTAIAAQLHAMAVHSQLDTAALPASRPFAVGQAGYDYFADDQHYRSLADRVLAGLPQGGRIVLVTADPPVNPSRLAAALTEATAGKHTVLAIACGGEFNEQQLRRAAGPSPLFLFHQADRLSDGQLAKLCSYLASGGNRPAGVLLGRSGFVPRLEELQPSLFKDGRAICFNFYELGRDEIEVFIRRQLHQSNAGGGFAVDEINWIADLSSGDPAQVDRLSRLMLELTGSMSGSDTRGDSTSQQAPSPSAPRWRRAARRPMLISILLCLGLSILLMLAGRPEFGGRIDAPAQSGGDGTLAPEQVPVSPPAVVPSAAETAPHAAPASAETAPLADPTAAPASAETAPPADPTAAPASAETAPPADPTAAPASAETAPPADPTAVPASAETAPPADPTAAPASAETAPPADPTAAPASAETAPPANPTAVPASAETARPADPTAVPASAETGAQDVQAAVTADKAPPPLPAEQITALVARGDAFVQTRDIASARLLYERAADAGNGRAALRMGESFDPAFLDSIGISRMLGDRRLALSWYRRACDLGDSEAVQLLQKLSHDSYNSGQLSQPW